MLIEESGRSWCWHPRIFGAGHAAAQAAPRALIAGNATSRGSSTIRTTSTPSLTAHGVQDCTLMSLDMGALIAGNPTSHADSTRHFNT